MRILLPLAEEPPPRDVDTLTAIVLDADRPEVERVLANGVAVRSAEDR